jgi:hypothetical protein
MKMIRKWMAVAGVEGEEEEGLGFGCTILKEDADIMTPAELDLA